MGVRTTADEQLDLARKHLQDAMENLWLAQTYLRSTVDKNVWGGNDWSNEFRMKVLKLGALCGATADEISLSEII